METIVKSGGRPQPVSLAGLEPADREAFSSALVVNLVRLVRAHDTFGTRDGREDPEVIREFIVTREQRRSIPIIADPDPKTLGRLKVYYSALAQTIEQGSGVIATPMLDISHEGFGRVVIIAGRLVAVDRHLRDVHRFGFESYSRLAADSDAIVSAAVAAIRQFPEVAGD